MTIAQATQTSTVGLVLEPLDVLFFRDGRPFEQASYARSCPLPLPQTVAGAITTALLRNGGCDFDKLRQDIDGGADFAQALANQDLEHLAQVRIRGPWLGIQHQESLHLLFAPPAHWRLKKTNGSSKESSGSQEPLVPLLPLPSTRESLPGWRSTFSHRQGLRPLWFFGSEELEPLPLRWVPWELMAKMLRQDEIPLKEACTCYAQCGLLDSPEGIGSWEQLAQRLPDLTAPDRRTGIGIAPERASVKKGFIYSVEFLALLWRPQRAVRCVLYVEVQLPQPAWPREIKTLHLGGEGRYVRVIPQAARPCWEELCLKPGQGEKPLVVLSTPGIFKRGWKPECLDQQEPLVEAAAVPGYEAVSGWDLARGGPKPSRFAVPAGSVYFLKEQPDLLPEILSDNPLDQQQGWGCYLQGVWKDE